MNIQTAIKLVIVAAIFALAFGFTVGCTEASGTKRFLPHTIIAGSPARLVTISPASTGTTFSP